MGFFKDLWNYAGEQGIRMPFIWDPVSKAPSITLMFTYITGFMAIVSTIALHFKPDLLVATGTSIAFWALAQVLYMVRKITKAGFNLKDRSITVEDNEPSAPAQQ
jgi:hypothetical protein